MISDGMGELVSDSQAESCWLLEGCILGGKKPGCITEK